nr:protein pxr1 [Quercus suber]
MSRRIKLSQDPNNTTWSKDTTNYGHRILAQQGWAPGQYLGAENASHAGHYSAANASHIRVLLRDDNLGLGAKVGGKANADTFGLSTLSGIFGRLNGKSEEVVQKQQGHLRDAELRTYQAQKYGFMNFVSGGLLVGDKMEELESATDLAGSKNANSNSPAENKLSTKRKAESNATDDNARKRSKDKNRKADTMVEAEEAVNVISRTSTTSEEAGQAHGLSTEQNEQADIDTIEKHPRKKRRKETGISVSAADETLEKARLKQEKKERKIERRKRKEAKRSKREAKGNATPAELTARTSDSESDASTPPPKPSFAGSRHAVRQRYIQQKRLASMDPKALKEILMITAKV